MTVLKKLFLFTIAFSSVFILGCERDDICADGTPTTPFIIVKFINNATRIETDIKRPEELQVSAVGVEQAFDIGTIRDSIIIPLRTDMSVTSYEFTINSDTSNDQDPVDTNIVDFIYTPVEEFVSSACGFRVVYNGLQVTEAEEGTDGDWIRGILVKETNVTDEAEAHILIFH